MTRNTGAHGTGRKKQLNQFINDQIFIIMGQRTAIILQVCRKEENKTETAVFYEQWGIGRIMPMELMSILNATITTSYYTRNYARALRPNGTIDITDDLGELPQMDFAHPENIGKVLRDCDNNNGGVFVRISTNGTYQIGAIEYAYMLGYEEGGDYKSFCTADEWMSKAGARSCDEEFRKLFHDTLDYFGAVEVVK